jgi:hypothetical protein
MDRSELDKVRERYSRLTDEELKELLLAGRSGFEPEAFTLLVEEARKRQIELGIEIAASEKDESPAQALEQEIETESYVELIVANHPDDVETIRRVLTGATINFYFQPISCTGKELPVALFVQQAAVEQAIQSLSDFQPKASIVTW